MTLKTMLCVFCAASILTVAHAEKVELQCAGTAALPDGKGNFYGERFKVTFFLTKANGKVVKVEEYEGFAHGKITESYGPKKTVDSFMTQLISDETGLQLNGSRTKPPAFAKTHTISNTGEYAFKSQNEEREGRCVSPKRVF